MRKSSSSAVGYKLSSTIVSFRGGTDSRPHQKRKKVAIGGYDKKWNVHFFFCIQIVIVPSGNKYLPDLSNNRFDFGTRSVPQTRKISTWLNIFFYHENVCVCVCMCVTISSYDHPILHFSPFISMYDMIWLEVLFVCVCRIRNEKINWEKKGACVRVYCAWRALNFRVSTHCILYFSSVYCSRRCEKNIWRKYTVREVGFSS